MKNLLALSLLACAALPAQQMAASTELPGSPFPPFRPFRLSLSATLLDFGNPRQLF